MKLYKVTIDDKPLTEEELDKFETIKQVLESFGYILKRQGWDAISSYKYDTEWISKGVFNRITWDKENRKLADLQDKFSNVDFVYNASLGEDKKCHLNLDFLFWED